MPNKNTFITDVTLKNIAEEIQTLKEVHRKEIIEKIKVARAKGNLSENAEFDEAKTEQEKIESRIMVLENLLKLHRPCLDA